jgi:hypothetical protein
MNIEQIMNFARKRTTGALVKALLLSLLAFPHAGVAAGEPGRSELDAMGAAARTAVLEHRPELAEKLESMPGYAVIAMSTTKIPGVGTGLGYGVITDNRGGEHSYIKVTQFEVGGGLGAQKFKVLILFKDEAVLERMIKGGWRYEGGADFSSSSGEPESTATLSSKSGKGYKVFRIAESGALATITFRVLHAKPYLVD